MANAAAAGQDALSPYQLVGLPHLGGVAKGVVHVNKCVLLPATLARPAVRRGASARLLSRSAAPLPLTPSFAASPTARCARYVLFLRRSDLTIAAPRVSFWIRLARVPAM